MARIGGGGEFNGYRRWHEADSVPPCDVQIVTSDGQSIPALSCVLASASPVLERMLERPGRAIQILGVPSDAVLAFVQFLYSSTRSAEEAMERHGVQLLALAHKYRVGWLKRASEAGVAARLTPERVADALKIAKLCDAPRLFHRCLRLAAKDFSAVQTSDGWRFVRRHDPALELEFLQLLQDAQQRKTKWKRDRAAQEAYQQLREAMDCLQHIFTEGCGCAYVGPTAGGEHASRPSKGPPASGSRRARGCGASCATSPPAPRSSPRGMPALQAHVAAPPPARRRLRPIRPVLQGPTLQPAESEDADGGEGRQDMAAFGEESEDC
uniref:BTB domain-containing protein n=1 Tax=Ananas comosus var. bracteatus TaxID=296719 RepID=A0A6V7Q2E3_ANACO|nr:unnamed protein product [Ananas comosus var. bracteatus]